LTVIKQMATLHLTDIFLHNETLNILSSGFNMSLWLGRLGNNFLRYRLEINYYYYYYYFPVAVVIITYIYIFLSKLYESSRRL
jgi:hypothetical protein